MASKRRKEYLPITESKYEVYHRTFDRKRISSEILNHGNMRVSGNSHINWSKTGLETLLLELKGDKDGVYLKGGQQTEATLPYLEKLLEEIKKEYENYSQSQVNTGQRRPKEMPKELWERFLKIEAEIDVTKEEIEWLEIAIKNYKQEEKKKDNESLLKYGLLGSGQLLGGILIEIDGQKVELINDELVISSKESPYYGMLVPDYYDLAKQWQEADIQLRYSKESLLNKLTAQRRMEDFQKEWERIENRLFEENPTWKDLLSKSFKNRLIPKFPPNIPKLFEEVKI